MKEVSIFKQKWTNCTRYTFTIPHGIINVSVFYSLPTIAHISDFYIDEDFRKQGIGKVLFSKVISYIKGHLKCEGATLSCHIDNPIYNYYSKLGFCRVADDGEGYYLMFKKILEL